MAKELISLTHSLNKDQVLKNEEAVVYLRLDLKADLGGGFRWKPINICLILDIMGSGYSISRMYRVRKSEVLTSLIQSLFAELREGDYISIITYGDDELAEIILPSTMVTSRNMKALEKQSLRFELHQGGFFFNFPLLGRGVNLAGGMRKGLLEIIKALSEEIKSQLFIFCDYKIDDIQECYEVAQQIVSAGIESAIIGVGRSFNSKQLANIGERLRGEALEAGNPAGLPEAIAERIRNWRSSATKMLFSEPKLKIIPTKGVILEEGYSFTPDKTKLEVESGEDERNIYLKGLESNPQQTYLLKFVMPPRPEGRYRIAQVQLSYVPPDSEEEKVLSEDIIVNYVSSPSERVNRGVVELITKTIVSD